ncbi:ester cyclase [uncultured Amnibacterium sp.]|uniref:ester cyclase n=1 Tax=uncultured Amnibacterium sp. TaxID=1631851 RepID=UPI0035C976A2
MDRRQLLQQGGAAALGALAIGAVAGGATPAEAESLWSATPPPHAHKKLPNPARTPVPDPPFPKGLTSQELRELKKFDHLDFVVFSKQEWSRLGETHAHDIRVHMADGTYTDGLPAHIASLKQLFSFAPDTHISEHPIRIAAGGFTAVTGVMRGTFTKPLTTPQGTVPPNGKKYAINMVTVGVWNKHETMDEEWLFWDNQSFFQQLGVGA